MTQLFLMSGYIFHEMYKNCRQFVIGIAHIDSINIMTFMGGIYCINNHWMLIQSFHNISPEFHTSHIFLKYLETLHVEWVKIRVYCEDKLFKMFNIIEELMNFRFYGEYGFPGVCGCVDGTHIAIVAPKTNDDLYPEHIYVNRKGYHSLNVQLVSSNVYLHASKYTHTYIHRYT